MLAVLALAACNSAPGSAAAPAKAADLLIVNGRVFTADAAGTTAEAIASQQPMHVVLGDMNQKAPSGPWPDNIGPERYARAWAWRRIMSAGGRVAFGSDWPVATLNPGAGIWLAATRVTLPGGVEQAMPMADVIRGYTSWAAYASFDEQRKGTLEPGMLTDIAVLTSDVFAKPPKGSDDIQVAATIFDGRVVCTRPQATHAPPPTWRPRLPPMAGS